MMVFSTQQAAVEVDVEQRILRNAVVATRSLASDGFIMDTAGMDLRRYQANPIVETRHGKDQTGEPTVIGRSLELQRGDREIVSVTQFADSRLGREYAYLYGVNPEGEVFMRAWSIDAPILEKRAIRLAEARAIVGPGWDDGLADKIIRQYGAIRLATRTELISYSAVARGADRGALSRAYDDGVGAAGEILTRMELTEAEGQILELRREVENQCGRIDTLESELLAMTRDGTAAARHGNTAELLAAIEELRKEITT